MRLDLYLKTVRLVKRRAVAKEMCEAGRVRVNGRDAGPDKEVRPGDRIIIRYFSRDLEVEVTETPGRNTRTGSETPYRIIAETRKPKTDEAW